MQSVEVDLDDEWETDNEDFYFDRDSDGTDTEGTKTSR